MSKLFLVAVLIGSSSDGGHREASIEPSLEPTDNRQVTGRDARLLTIAWQRYEKEVVPELVRQEGQVWSRPEMHIGAVMYPAGAAHAIVLWMRNQKGFRDEGHEYFVNLKTLRIENVTHNQ